MSQLIEAPTTEEFESLLGEVFGVHDNIEGSVVRGKIINIDRECVLVDIGLKSEGRIPLSEFDFGNEKELLTIGNFIDVYVDGIENRHGEAVLSRDKARREEAWVKLEKAHENNEQVEGVITSRVKGGFTVDVLGAMAFLPGSQVDVRPIRDISPLMENPQKFVVLKMDYQRGNIVVSRRAIIESERAEQRTEIIENLAEGQVVEGIVKNITDYGAFVDLGGIDGLLHVTDIYWKRINHPSEALKLGDTVKVVITKISDTKRLSLGMKQLEPDPWEGIEERFPVGTRVKGKVTNIADYGAFVELEDSIEGLIYVTELSWTKKNLHPNRIVNPEEEVEVEILDIDFEKRRISLGLKQCIENPWEIFARENLPGTELTGKVRNITEFGMFISVSDDIDGMVHLNDISWTQPGDKAIKEYRKGADVSVKILEVDVEKERISLGIKQLGNDPAGEAFNGIRKGATLTSTVTNVTDNGLEVQINDEVTGFIRKNDLSRDRSEQRPSRFNVGDKVDAHVVQLDRSNFHATLSIKSLEISEEKEAVKQYGSSDSGASLGDILGVALKEKEENTKK